MWSSKRTEKKKIKQDLETWEDTTASEEHKQNTLRKKDEPENWSGLFQCQ